MMTTKTRKDGVIRSYRWRAGGALAAVLALALAGTAAGCSGGSGATAKPGAGRSGSGGTLTVAFTADVAGLDPQPAASGATWRILNTVYETLVGLDDQLRPAPKLATGWKQTSPTTYVFDIRRGVKFTNGREMTVDDVVGSIKRLTDPKLASLWAGMLGPLTGVTAVGDNQVKIVLPKPRSSFVSSLANLPAAIIPMKELKAGTFDPTKTVMGTGPFMVTAHRAHESWTLVRNPHYWGTPAKVQRLNLKIITDESALAAGLRSGSVDVAAFDSPDVGQLLKGQAGIATVVQKTTSYYEVLVNALSSPLRDQRLRQAVALSIDRNKIRDVALAGSGQPTSMMTPPGMTGSCDSESAPLSTLDLTRARQLVAAAGAQGKTISILANTAQDSKIAQVLQQNLQAIGLKVRVEVLEIGQMLTRIFTPKTVNFDLAINWFAGYNDPSLVTTWWNPALAKFNLGFMKPDEELNRLIAQGFATPSGPDRTEALQQACNRAAEGANMIPLVTRPNVVASRSDKVRIVLSPIDALGQPLLHVAEFAPR